MTERLPHQLPWHPEVIDPAEVTPPTPAELTAFRDMTKDIADTMATLRVPARENYLRNDGQIRLYTGRQTGRRHAGRLYVAYTEIPFGIDSSQVCYRINETQGMVSLELEQRTPRDNVATSLGNLIYRDESFIDQAIEEAMIQRAKATTLKTEVPGLGSASVSRDELQSVMSDMHTSWAIRRVELGLASIV